MLGFRVCNEVAGGRRTGGGSYSSVSGLSACIQCLVFSY